MSGDSDSITRENSISSAAALSDRVTVITGDGKSKRGFFGVRTAAATAAAVVMPACAMFDAAIATFASALAVNGTRQGGPASGGGKCQRRN